MRRRLTDALDAGLAALKSGDDLSGFLSQNPDVASELRPLLGAAQAASALPAEEITSPAFQRTRSRMLARAEQLRALARRRRRTLWTPGWAAAASAAVLVLFFSAAGLVVASATTIPGDDLYPLKRVIEDLSLNLAPGGRMRNGLQVTYQQRREVELEALTRLGEDDLAATVLAEIQPTEAAESLAASEGSGAEPPLAPTAPPPTEVPATDGPASETPEVTAVAMPATTMTPTMSGSPSPTPTQSPTPQAATSCESITIDEWDSKRGEVEVDDDEERYEYEDGGRLRFHVRNDNEEDVYLTASTLHWNTAHAPPMYMDFFRFKGERYYRTDSTSSPVSAAAPRIELEEEKWWEAVFYLGDQPFEGEYTVELTFELEGLGACTVSAQAQLP